MQQGEIGADTFNRWTKFVTDACGSRCSPASLSVRAMPASLKENRIFPLETNRRARSALISSCAANAAQLKRQTFGENSVRVCGVEIKGSEAIFAVAHLAEGKLSHIPTETKRIALADDDTAANVRSFAEVVAGFLRDNNLSHVAIKKRGKKGEYAGGPTTFKIEGVFQLIKECHVDLLSAPTIAAQDRKHIFPSPESLNKYQLEAFRAGCASLVQRAQKK